MSVCSSQTIREKNTDTMNAAHLPIVDVIVIAASTLCYVLWRRTCTQTRKIP
nr:hypothetical protein [uncultured Selenomonas sp.]